MRARRQVIVFARAPRLGAVKTRLARDVGAAAARAFYVATALSTVRRLVADGSFDVRLDLAPEGGRRPDPWPRGVPRAVQRGSDLGARMLDAFRRAGPGPVLLVGSDIPGLRAHHLRAAFRALGTADAVFGPAEDGGYWLVGFRRRPLPHGVFAGVRWSGPHALADTLARLGGRRVALVALLSDVDDGADLARLSRAGPRARAGGA